MAQVIKRTFEAKKYPKGSPERARLNLHTETSEYYPSRKYCVIYSDGFRSAHITKREAEQNAARHD